MRAETLPFAWPDASAAQSGHAVPGVGHLLHFEARRWQQVRAMPFRRPTLIRVCNGVKQARLQGELIEVGPDQVLAVPAGLSLDLGNVPDGSGAYRALIMQFAPELLQRFALAYPETVRDVLQSAPRLQLLGRASPDLDQGLRRLLAAPSGGLGQIHAALGVLLSLAEAGLGHLLLGRQRQMSDRVHDLVELQPDFPWTAAEVAARFAISVPTLHRQLRATGQGLADILQEVRLAHGLQRILTTSEPIADIAAACGYASPSRFSARFRQRFGCAPSDLR